MYAANGSRPVSPARGARKLLVGLCGALLGGAMISIVVAAQDGNGTGTAVVHVTVADVVVTVGDARLAVDVPSASPFVCELPAGKHRLTTRRGAAVLQSEEFTVRDGEEVVLTAWASLDATGESGD